MCSTRDLTGRHCLILFYAYRLLNVPSKKLRPSAPEAGALPGRVPSRRLILSHCLFFVGAEPWIYVEGGLLNADMSELNIKINHMLFGALGYKYSAEAFKDLLD